MQRVSTNLTLFYKLFIPVFWLSFAGAATIATLALSKDSILRIIVPAIYLFSIILLYFTLFRLKRVEMGDEAIYVTDYFRHFQYPYNNIEKITHQNYLILQTATIYLHTPGSFGKKMTFVPSKSLYKIFWESHPELKAMLIK